MNRSATQATMIHPEFAQSEAFQFIPADVFPTTHPVDWLHSHFAVGGWSPLQRLSGMLTAHMTQIAPQNGFTWHPHRGLEIYTWMHDGRQRRTAAGRFATYVFRRLDRASGTESLGRTGTGDSNLVHRRPPASRA